MPFRSIVLFVLALTVVASVLYLRRRPRPRIEVVEREQEVVLPSTTAASALPSPPPIATPAATEVQPTLDRVFGQTLTVDQATRPAFVAGDFNGDDVTDLVVAVRPSNEEALPVLNGELTNWRRQDANASPDAASRPEAVKVAAGDLLLAVVHGAGVGGWRDPEALQGYLVKNAVGSGMRPRPLTGMPAAVRMRVYRSHTGDAIAGVRGGAPGLVFWTGVAYSWADLRAH